MEEDKVISWGLKAKSTWEVLVGITQGSIMEENKARHQSAIQGPIPQRAKIGKSIIVAK